MQRDLTAEEYSNLYKAYLNSDPKEILEIAGMQEGHRVLDLCSGPTGRVERAAIEMGASYVASVDINPQVLKLKGKKWAMQMVEPFCLDVYGYLEYSNSPQDEKFDIVICRQGINHWFSAEMLAKVIGVMKKKGSKFVFDTFNKKPPECPVVKEYKLSGKKYVEITWMIQDQVNHVQIVDDSSPHYSELKWIEPEHFMKICEKSYLKNTRRITIKSTDTYICERKAS